MLSLDLQVSTTRLDYFILSIFEMFNNEFLKLFKFSLFDIKNTENTKPITAKAGMSIIIDIFS